MSFADFIGDMLTSQIAVTEGSADFIVRQSEDELIYVDVDSNELFLITVKKGKLHVQGEAEDSPKPREEKDSSVSP